jgi:hypothetical protein
MADHIKGQRGKIQQERGSSWYVGGCVVGVNGRGGEGGSEETSMTFGIFGGREDDLLGSEERKGSRGDRVSR